MSAQQTSPQSTQRSGWFTDPLDPARIRYWDGQAWTHQTAARVELPPPVGAPHPAPATPGPGIPPSAAAGNHPNLASAAATNTPIRPTGVPISPGYQPGPMSGYDAALTPDQQPATAGGRSGRKGRRGSGSVGMRANMFTSAAVVLGILAIVFMPLYLGVLAIASGALAFVRGERRAATGLKVAIIGMIIGIALAYVSSRFGIALPI